MWTKEDVKLHFEDLRVPTDAVIDFTKNNRHGAVGKWVEQEFLKYSGCNFNLGEGVDLPDGLNGDTNPYEVKTHEYSSDAFLTVGAYSKNAIITSNGLVCLEKLTTNIIYITWCKLKGVVKSVKFINNNTKFVKNDIKNSLHLAASEIATAKEPSVHSSWLRKNNAYPFVMTNKGRGMVQVRLTQKQLLGRTLRTGFIFE
jgi:hypothetical protein